MANSRRVVIEFLGDDKSASRTARSVDGSTSKLGATFSKVGKMAAVGLGAGLAIGATALVGMTKNAIEDEAAQRKLATALQNAAGATDKQIASVEDWVSKTAMATGVADDELRPAFQRLVEATGDVSEAQRQMDIAMDVSAGTGKSLKTVSEALMKANNGTVSSLSRLGLKTKDAEGNTLSLKDALSKMSDTFKGQAEAKANSLEGKMARLNIVMDETKEAIGAKLIPVLTKMADWVLQDVLPAMEKFGNWFGEVIKPKLDRFVALVAVLMGQLVGWFRTHWDEIKEIFKNAVSIVKSLWERFGDNILTIAKAAFEHIKSTLKGAFTIIKGIFKVFSGILKGDWAKVWDGIKDILKGAWTVIKSLIKYGWTVIKELFKAAGGILKDVMKGVWEGIKDAVRNGVIWYIDFIRSIPGRLMDLAGKFASAGKDLIGAFVDGMKNAAGIVGGIAGNVWDTVKGLLNGAIDKINSALEFEISIPGPNIHINTPDIPHLAKGGIVTKPTIALIGEAGPEAVVPLSKARSLGGGGNFTATTPVVIQLDSRTVWQGLLKLKRTNGGVELGLA